MFFKCVLEVQEGELRAKGLCPLASPSLAADGSGSRREEHPPAPWTWA